MIHIQLVAKHCVLTLQDIRERKQAVKKAQKVLSGNDSGEQTWDVSYERVPFVESEPKLARDRK